MGNLFSRKNVSIAVGVLVAVLIALCVLSVKDFRQLRRTAFFGARMNTLAAIRSRHGHMTTADVDLIQTWMTFDYLNAVFMLPPDYLRESLHITDARYPFLTLTKFARGAGVDQNTVLARTQDEVRQWLASTTPRSLNNNND